MGRRLVFGGSLLGAAFAFVLGGTASFADTVTLRMSTWLPPKHHHTAVALPTWIAAVEEASGGTLKIKIDPAPIAKPPGQYDVVRDGAADMSYHVVAYTPGPFEILRGAELPFLSPSAEVGSQAAYDWYDRNVGFDAEFKDVKIITMFVHGPGAVHTKEPVKTLDDLAGVKLRVGGGGVRMAEALGATPVAMPAPKSYEAIQKGVADGAMFPFESIAGFRLGELVNYHLEIPGGLYTTPFAVMMNPAKYDSLSDAHKQVLADVGGVNGAKILGAAWDDADTLGRKAAEEQGGVFHTLDGAELEKWAAKIAFMDADWIAKADAAGLDGTALLADLKATIAKYSN
ncbi:TRAP transporter substrate-binding protein, partial [uncultured Sulfitobacter sp.]|uniref:TRAP transporter substrate-binding protein n=1 Tax=uncultured Sulfitobacter sp. TaxID=191468 RepID=UPI00261BEC4A